MSAPTVKTLNARITADGKAMIKGLIVSNGSSPIVQVGVDYSTISGPVPLAKQISATQNGDSIEVEIANLSADSTYYFMPWAKNQKGIGYGSEVMLDSIYPTPINVPCSLPAQQLEIGYFPNTITIDSSVVMNTETGDFLLRMNAQNGTFDVIFHEAPHAGVYTTTNEAYATSGKVYLAYTYNNLIYSSDAGKELYVNWLSNHEYELQICDGTTSHAGTTKSFKARFIINLP